MSQDKNEVVINDTEALTKINRRLDYIDKTNNKLIIRNKNYKEKIYVQEKLQKEEISKIREEFKELDKQITKLKKVTFAAGKKLREKVNKDEIENLKDMMNKWTVEEFMKYDELEKAWNNYNKNAQKLKEIFSTNK